MAAAVEASLPMMPPTARTLPSVRNAAAEYAPPSAPADGVPVQLLETGSYTSPSVDGVLAATSTPPNTNTRSSSKTTAVAPALALSIDETGDHALVSGSYTSAVLSVAAPLKPPAASTR